MPQADIEINGTAASDENLPINTLVQLSNNDVGDESTYLWEIVDQPPGPADALSSTVIENPSLTPQKEGTYLLKLTVDQALPTEQTDTKLFRVRHLKTFQGLIAAQEVTEADSARGWATRQNENHQTVVDRIFDGELVVAVANEAMVTGNVVRFTTVETIKSGLPGEERLPGAVKALATDAVVTTAVIGVMVSRPDGVTAAAINDLVLVRIAGYLDAQQTGAPALGDAVFVSDTGTIALVAGTNTRQVAQVIETGAGLYRVFVGPQNTNVIALEEGGVAVTNTPHNTIDFDDDSFNVTDNGDGSATVVTNPKVTLEEGGAPVTNTPHDTIDFDATDFDVTDNADGSATVTANPTLVATAFAEVTVNTSTTATEAAPATLLSINITPDDAGNSFLVHVSAAADNTQATDQIISFQIWYGLTGAEAQQRAAYIFSDSTSDNAGSCAIVMKLAALGAGQHTVQVRWGVTGGTAQVFPVTRPDRHHASLLVQEVTV